MAAIKAINGVAWASLKTFDNVAAASLKTLDTIDPCLVKGTPVIMADGTIIPIEQIKEGDRIRTYRIVDKEIAEGKVTWVQKPKWVNAYLKIKAEDGTELKITKEHPVFIMTNDNFGKFINAGEVKVGQKFLNKDNKLVAITGIEKVEKKVEVYNFTVDKYHNYFGAGLLCHNTIA